MIKCKHSTGLFIKSSYMNQVNSLTSIPHEPIVVVHKATMVANRLHKTGIKWGTVQPANKNLLFFKVWQDRFLYFGVLNGNLGYVGS